MLQGSCPPVSAGLQPGAPATGQGEMAPESGLPFPVKQLILTGYMSVNRCRGGKRDEGILVQLEEVFIAAF